MSRLRGRRPRHGAATENLCALCGKDATRAVRWGCQSDPTPVSLCSACEPGKTRPHPPPCILVEAAPTRAMQRAKRAKQAPAKTARVRARQERRAREKKIDAIMTRAAAIAARTRLPLHDVEEALKGGRSEADLLAFATGASR